VHPFTAQRKSLSVLVVEDDVLLRDSIRRMLEAEGHRVARACDGQQAAAAIRQESFDLLVIDLLFPGIRTLEAVVEWSRDPSRGRILGLSRFARILPRYYLSLTRKLGMDVILTKPFEPAQLAEAIAEVLAEPAGRRDAWQGRDSSAVA
jgi:CheY-like chemotaxis protein